MEVKYKNVLRGIGLFKDKNGNTRTICEICSKLSIMTVERRRSGVFIVNFERISYIFLAFPLLALNR